MPDKEEREEEGEKGEEEIEEKEVTSSIFMSLKRRRDHW